MKFVRLAAISSLVTACATQNHAGTPGGSDAASADGGAPVLPDGGVLPDGDARSSCSQGALCDGETGLCVPVPECSSAAPCVTTPLLDGGASTTIAQGFVAPASCRTGSAALAAGRPNFDDGPPRGWVDATDGAPRAACVYRPPGASPSSPRPLVVFFHGGGGSATDIYDAMSLRAKATDYGFVLAADQGRYLQWPNRPGGPVHDFYYRDFTAPSSNPDVRNADKLIDDLVSEGGIDSTRIFVMGWSNGGWFAQAYAIARSASPTPGGHRVAAVALYSSGDPYENISDTQAPTCALLDTPKTAIPLFLIHRACDINGCNEAQKQLSGQPPGSNLAEWVARLRSTLDDPNVQDIVLDERGQEATVCTPIPPCSSTQATLNHLRWPDGVADHGGNDWEPRMLSFLQSHPLP